MSTDIKDILEIENDDLTFLLNIEDKSKYTILVDCSYEVLKNIFVFPKNTPDLKNRLYANFKERYNISLADYYIDFMFSEISEEIVTYICGSPRNYVDTIAKFLTENKFKLLALESDIDALGRGLYTPDETSLKIHVMDNEILIMVTKGKTLLAERLVTFGYKNVIDNFAKHGGIDFEQAKSLFESKGFFDEDINDSESVNMKDAVIDSLDMVGIEVQKTLDMFYRSFKNGKVDKIIISGKFINVNKVNIYFTKLFNIETEIVNILQQISVDEDMQELLAEATALEIAIGAALRSKF
ncbi:pilus assembly protein PilM [Deferribacterales bacterium Es71-Z0220]|uniref:pilus assembly protein PilM n=1 Tax=Deferrivibrio essentukiensis TaxID=2880922 RepID=UPI001F60DD71|nr:pilus assembly protein PilM [Deferrivibrio essentukiensis]MCB4205318.1 pilus assembly protein PilM [Deferrivibrio essentukiensis]